MVTLVSENMEVNKPMKETIKQKFWFLLLTIIVFGLVGWGIYYNLYKKPKEEKMFYYDILKEAIIECYEEYSYEDFKTSAQISVKNQFHACVRRTAELVPKDIKEEFIEDLKEEVYKAK